MNKLYTLMNRKSSVAAKDKLRTVKTVYIPSFLYRSETWTTAAHIASRREYKSQ